MPDNRPIAVFDSGIGGITAVKELMTVLPGEDIVYFGDTARVPYGTRSAEIIRKYTMQNIRFLHSFDVKAFLVACGTMSNVIDAEMEGFCSAPLAGVIGPASEKAVSLTRTGKIGVIATQATISFGSYERHVRTLNPEVQVISKACPLFVPLVENGRIHRGDIVIETVAREYLTPIMEAGVDTLIMGCTHYPLIEGIINSILGPNVALVNAGRQAALSLREVITPSDKTSGTVRYYVSDSAANFSAVASMFLGETIDAQVQKIELY